MFRLTPDLKRRRLEVAMSGFWDDTTIDGFERAFAQAVDAFSSNGGLATILVDACDFSVQSQAVADRLERLNSWLIYGAGARVALILPGQLVKRQALRSAAAMEHRSFTDRAEAAAWLDQFPVSAENRHRA